MLDLSKRRQRVKELARRGGFDEAITECHALLEQFPEAKADLLRLRAYVYATHGKYHEAIADRKELIASGEGVLRDYYLLGDNSISLGQFREAAAALRELLRLGAEQKEDWFESAAFFLLSYSEMQLGRLQEASEYLERAVARDPDCALPIRGYGIMTYQQLGELINRRSRG